MIRAAIVTIAATVATLTPACQTPAQRTCAAFKAWDAYPTASQAGTMMRDSIAAPWQPVGIAADNVYRDARNKLHNEQSHRDITVMRRVCARIMKGH